MKLKVCGLKYKENILDVAEAMPDYMGFIFYPKSKRYVGRDFILTTLDNAIKKVGVFVNESAEIIKKQILKYELDLVQLHGDESPEFCAEINKTTPVIKAFGINESFDFKICTEYKNTCSYFLFDTKTPEYGGSGIKFEWTALNKYKMDVPFFLSGGITMNDVSMIQRLKHPALHAIDVNSGFETEPGFKNIKLLKQFSNEI